MPPADQTNKLTSPTSLSESELAQRWKVSTRTIQRWRHEGRLLEWFSVGRKVLYRVEAIEAIERAAPPRPEQS